MYGFLISCGDGEKYVPYDDPNKDDSNRDNCKKVCEKMLQCNDIEEGGSGALNNQWLTNCKNACDEADEIESTITNCMLNTECENIAKECGS